MDQSIGFSPAAATRTRIRPGPACGAGTSRRLRTSGPPNDSSWTARLVSPACWRPVAHADLSPLAGNRVTRSGLCSVYKRHRTIIGACVPFGRARDSRAAGEPPPVPATSPRSRDPRVRLLALAPNCRRGAIARQAGVGIATLDPHLHTGTLVDAVHRDQVARLTDGARELLAQLPPPAALRRWMELFGDWIATKNGMLVTLLGDHRIGRIARCREPRRPSCSRPSTNSPTPLAGCRGQLRADLTAEDIAASLIGIFTVAHPPEHDARASRLLNIRATASDLHPDPPIHRVRGTNARARLTLASGRLRQQRRHRPRAS